MACVCILIDDLFVQSSMEEGRLGTGLAKLYCLLRGLAILPGDRVLQLTAAHNIICCHKT